MASFWVWAVALVGYAVFLSWCVNWRGPRSPAEIETLMARLTANGIGHGDQDEMPVMRRFLEADDGREFFMLNVIRFSDDPVADPVAGARPGPRAASAAWSTPGGCRTSRNGR